MIIGIPGYLTFLEHSTASIAMASLILMFYPSEVLKNLSLPSFYADGIMLLLLSVTGKTTVNFLKSFILRRTVVVGGGYIAVELSSILSALESDVHLLIRKPKVLWDFDRTLSDCLTESIDRGPTKLHKKTEVSFLSYLIYFLNYGALIY